MHPDKKNDHEIPHPRNIHFHLDGEEYCTEQHDQTPNSILQTFGQKDPASYYLVHLQEHCKISYRDQGNHPIHLDQHDKFISVCVGPTPVSDLARSGIEGFVQGLITLGLAPQIHPSSPQHVHFNYTVEEGARTGEQVQLGFIVPPDFPVTPPSGLHVSPRIHGGIAVGTDHPNGGIHGSAFGGDWEYWSRPHPTWQQEAIKSAGTYMAHVRRLWVTQ